MQRLLQAVRPCSLKVYIRWWIPVIGEGANKEVTTSIRVIANSFAEVERVNELLTMHMGPDFLLVNISICFKRGQLTREIESVIAEIDSAIKAQHVMVKRIFVEAEAA